jgi:segregation and condensation protein A
MYESLLSSKVPVYILHGEPYFDLPSDLYIPPHALEIFLSQFSGPLDLLLYLIKRDNIPILDIPIARITETYMGYIQSMLSVNIPLASEYLYMASTLMHIKSAMLLPRPNVIDEEDDPRMDLVKQLQQYELFKEASLYLDACQQVERDVFKGYVVPTVPETVTLKPTVSLNELILSMQMVMNQLKTRAPHEIIPAVFSVEERMVSLFQRLKENGNNYFHCLCDAQEGIKGLIVSFLAMLELCRLKQISISQDIPYEPIFVEVI